MSTVTDVLVRTAYMSLFFILLPLGAYTIHTGMSAIVAGVTYGILSCFVPLWYIRSKETGFGPNRRRVPWWGYLVSWILVQGLTYMIFTYIDLTWLWSLSTIGRDCVFAVIMYGQVSLALTMGLIVSRTISSEV